MKQLWIFLVFHFLKSSKGGGLRLGLQRPDWVVSSALLAEGEGEAATASPEPLLYCVCVCPHTGISLAS